MYVNTHASASAYECMTIFKNNEKNNDAILIITINKYPK